jgi:hypothetical protein
LIIKSISHTGSKKSARKLIKYIFDGRKPLEDPQGRTLIFKQHIRGYDREKWAKQFEDLEQQRKSHYGNKSVVAYHEVISFSDKSTKHLTRTILKDLIGRYIKMRTNGQMLCIGTIHFEKNKNWHGHLIFSGIKTTNFKSSRISKTMLATVKSQLQDYQMKTYPFLEDSIVRHGLKKKN